MQFSGKEMATTKKKLKDGPIMNVGNEMYAMKLFLNGKLSYNL